MSTISFLLDGDENSIFPTMVKKFLGVDGFHANITDKGFLIPVLLFLPVAIKKGAGLYA